MWLASVAWLALLDPAAPAAPAWSVDEARSILFDALGPAPPADACADGDERARITCLIGRRFSADKKAAALAEGLFHRQGTVVGTLPAQTFDGDYRGILKLVPRVPVKADRVHLQWLVEAFDDIDALLDDAAVEQTRFRTRALEVRFFESVKRKTPSAVAQGWSVAYNVRGSLFLSAARVRETLFHELFHLNDSARGWWSAPALSPIYDAIVKKCGMKKDCLKPYAPDGIVVKGGTYYAFMPDNGVKEYAADIGKRWYVEHHALWKKQKLGVPWKCLAPENAQAWRLVVDELFGGVDRTPPC